MIEYALAVGDYAKSSWSMRAWLVLKAAAAPFDTLQVRLERPDTRANILRHSPSGKVPALIMKDGVIHDSLAIAETIAEKFPQANLWPKDDMLRGKARSAAAEMHSGFVNLRTQLPFGISSGERIDQILPDTQSDIDRVLRVWRDLRAASGSMRFLCGDFGIVDAMFTPVVFRFHRFGIGIPDDLKYYVDAIFGNLHVEEWLELAQNELRASSTAAGLNAP
ncbi:MAG TPA: glutathione S-transferase [Rhodocyclaceae bacterium]|nr:glutathione S-transferase [Rhodocyclaceae bacterium]